MDELTPWRAQMEAALRAEDGWLALAGLYWLPEGASTFGSGADQDLVFAVRTCPAHWGTLHRAGDTVLVEFARGERVQIDGDSVKGCVALRHDGGGPQTPAMVTYRSLSFHVLVRGPRVGIRLRDAASTQRQDFTGRIWYDANDAAVLTAWFEPNPAGTTIAITNVLGDTEPTPSPGRAHFEYGGCAYSLDAVTSGEELLFNFRDLTNGVSTYGAGRFLFVSAPAGPTMTLDFNRAVSPPCAFTTHATCPLAPAQNHLPTAIAAGERYDGSHHPRSDD